MLPLYFDNLYLLIFDFCTHFVYIEYKGKVYSDLVFTKMSEPFVCHIILYLSTNSYQFYIPFPLYFIPLSEVSLSRALFLYSISLWFNSIVRLSAFDLKHIHLRGILHISKPYNIHFREYIHFLF